MKPYIVKQVTTSHGIAAQHWAIPDDVRIGEIFPTAEFRISGHLGLYTSINAIDNGSQPIDNVSFQIVVPAETLLLGTSAAVLSFLANGSILSSTFSGEVNFTGCIVTNVRT
jgi:hypothetical protein